MNLAGNAPLEADGFVARLRATLVARAVLLLLLLAFLVVALIGAVGMGASTHVLDSVQGSASAINVAGSLRRLSHRAAGLAVARGMDAAEQTEVIVAVAQFEGALSHEALRNVIERDPSGLFASIFRGVEASWRTRIRPRLIEPPEPEIDDLRATGYYRSLLAEIDAFAEQINTLVAVLEHDAESRIEQLHRTLGWALALLVGGVLGALYLLQRRMLQPLTDLRGCAVRIAHGDFGARSRFTGRDELGRVGEAFNTMAGELSVAYHELEDRVAKKTEDLTRSNRALELLYYVISRLYHAPTSSETYAETLRDLERTLGLRGSFICVEPKHGGPATVLSSSMGSCMERSETGDECLHCPGRQAPWGYQHEGDVDVLLVPLRDAERQYGMLRLALPPGQRLQEWERTLLEAVSRHMGIALGISRQGERDRLLALQEERSIIARELHDSLAQSLSFMKIQVSLLAPALAGPAPREDAEAILADLREGISAAYRQLRELLSTFRLRIEGDVARLLGNTVSEYASRSGIPIDLEIHLGRSHLSPNQEIHVLHIVREALSNATRHARASRIRVVLTGSEDGEVTVAVEDDGCGIAPAAAAEPHHFGLTIMCERARGLGGSFEIAPRAAGGTRVAVRFRTYNAHPLTPASPLPETT